MDGFGSQVSAQIVQQMYEGARMPQTRPGEVPEFEAVMAQWRRALARSTDLEANDADMFGNGDQRQLRYGTENSPGQVLIDTWSNGCDAGVAMGSMGQERPPPILMSSFMRACILGDLAAVRAEIAAIKAREAEAAAAAAAAAAAPATSSASEPVTSSASAPTTSAEAKPAAKECSVCGASLTKAHYSNSQWAKPADMRKCAPCVVKVEAGEVAVAPPAKSKPPTATKEPTKAKLHPANYACKNLEELLERREFLLRFSPLLACVSASRVIGRRMWPAAMEARADHMGVARALVEAGAKVNAKDIAGYTALHHALSAMSTDLSLRIAVYLCAHGADVEATTRVGRSVACDAIMSRQTAPLKLAIEAGYYLNPTDQQAAIYWKEGGELLSKARARFGGERHSFLTGKRVSVRRTMRGLCGEYDPVNGVYKVKIDGGAEEVPVAAEDVSPVKGQDAELYCSYPPCEELSKAATRCRGCKQMAYCSDACRTKHWKEGHEQPCTTAAAGVTATLPPAGKAPAKRFIVKVQVPLVGMGGGAPAMVYDKSRAYQVMVPPSHASFALLTSTVRERGYMGAKAYLWARAAAGGTVEVDCGDVLDLQPW